MAKTVVGLFRSIDKAEDAVQDLVSAGIARSDISLVAQNEGDRYSERYKDYLGRTDASTATGARAEARTEGVGAGIAKGAGAGAAIGGGIGLVAGLASLAIPGFGPVIAAGPLAAALTGAGIGAAAGGLIGGLTRVGVPEHEAEYYAEGVRRGGVLVTVRTDDTLADRAADIMEDQDADDVEERASEWRTSGWTPTYAGATGGITGSGRGWSGGASPGSMATTGTSTGAGRLGSDATETYAESRARRARMYDYSEPTLYTEYDADYRRDYEGRYASYGRTYEYYAPAYRFGSQYANDTRYSNRNWADIEPDLRRDWEARGQGAWEDFKDAVRHGWDRIRGRR